MKNMKRNVQQGFTLIELMIVIAIVAILVALAVPAYQDYTIRAKVAECIGQAASAKIAVAEHYQSLDTLPTSSAQAGIPAVSTTYCAGVAVGNGGAITVTMSAASDLGTAASTSATFKPTTGSGNISSWSCLASASPQYYPATCRPT